MEQLLEIEKKMFKERVELQEQVNKQPGHKQKIKKLKELLEESYAQNIVLQAKAKLEEFSFELKRKAELRKKQLIKEKRQTVKEVADSNQTRVDLKKQYPKFDMKNIQFYIDVACEGHSRFHGTLNKSHLRNIKLSKELEQTKEIIKNLKRRQEEENRKKKEKQQKEYTLLDL